MTVFTGAVVFFRLGSFEDRILVGVLWLSLVLFQRNATSTISRD